MLLEQVLMRLRSMVRGDVRSSEPMSRHTSFRVGGPADLYLRPADRPSLVAALDVLAGAGLPVLVVGLGTNLLVRDGGIRGAVVSTALLGGWHLEGDRLVARCGSALSGLARATARAGWSGLEFAAGIPGTLGGAVAMNAGAHGACLADVLERVTVLGDSGPLTLGRDEAGFAYRDSRVRREKLVVTEAVLRLRPTSPAQAEERIRQVLRARAESQPRGVPSAGSFFRNPPGMAAGALIEQAGCKGMRVGGAEVSPVHANFLVNRGGASARDVLTLAARVRERVAERFGIWLEPEVEVVGEDPT
ncbi:MAG: UDP-N-acetylmuramate dehydrogenase [Bacillota bacterium]|nr:UDP-N-acetylmuramate dehydrogenase [Bacillota bacterium]